VGFRNPLTREKSVGTDVRADSRKRLRMIGYDKRKNKKSQGNSAIRVKNFLGKRKWEKTRLTQAGILMQSNEDEYGSLAIGRSSERRR